MNARIIRASLAVALSCAAVAGCSTGSEQVGSPAGAASPTPGIATTPPSTAAADDEQLVFGPQSVRVLSIRGKDPVTLRLLAPPDAAFRLRQGSEVALCNVVGVVGDQAPPAGAPSNVTSRYAVECQARDARGGVLLATVSAGAFTYEFEAPIARG